MKSVLNKHKKRDEWFLDDYSLNPYQNCELNCVYCYTHGSKYGRGVPREIGVKINTIELLEKALKRRAKKKEYGFIALSSATEAWMHIEREYCITRKSLELIEKYRFPVHCLTKSTLIMRDIDLLERIDRIAILPSDLQWLGHGVLVTISISSINPDISRIFEPGAPTPKTRLETLEKIRNRGLYAGIAYIPVLPFLSDSDEDLEKMVSVARDYNASYVFIGALTLYGDGKRMYYKVIERHYPELLKRYKKLYSVFSQPSKEYQQRLEKKVKELCKKYGILYGVGHG